MIRRKYVNPKSQQKQNLLSQNPCSENKQLYYHLSSSFGTQFPAEPVFITTCCVYLGEMPTVFRASKKKIQAGGTRMKTALVDVLGSTLSGETHVMYSLIGFFWKICGQKLERNP